MKIMHVITGLDVGGAENVLLRLLQGQDPTAVQSEVVSIAPGGKLAREILALDVPVHELGTSRNDVLSARKLGSLLRDFGPEIVQTWMYHGDLIGGTTARLLTHAAIVWGIHSGPPPLGGFGIRRTIGMRALAALSHKVPSRIICCSETSREIHSGVGYAAHKMVVVPNGFATAPQVDRDAGALIREELGISRDSLVVGRVARDHPQKDIPTLISAFILMPDPEVHLVVVGRGLTQENEELVRLLPDDALARRVHLLGEREDVQDLYAAFDVSVSSSSFGEALPLVLGESMSRGVPVVSTDVGDAVQLIGDDTRVVPPRDPAALAGAILRVLQLPEEERRTLGIRDRERVASRYSLERMVAGYSEVYQEVATERDLSSDIAPPL